MAHRNGRRLFDEVEQGGKWDWSLGIEAELDDAKLGLAYLDSDAGRPALVAQAGFSLSR